MSEVNLFRTQGDTVQDFEGGQSSWEKAKSLSTRNFEGS
jgi:hypothetical protein